MSRKSSGSRRKSTPSNTVQIVTVIIVVLVLAFFAYDEYKNGQTSSTTPQPTAAPLQATKGPAAGAPTPPADANQRGTTGWYQVYFTTPRYPDKAAYHHGSIDEQLVAFINTATKTIDLADYDYDLENVSQALVAAVSKGVRVRMVTDTDTYTSDNKDIQKALAILKQARIPVVDDKRQPIMHHKFMVVDNAAVWTGSWNFTTGDTYRLNNNAITIQSPQLAQNYTAEFEKMFVLKKFGPTKPVGVPYPSMTIGGVHVENYFASEGDANGDVADHITTHLKAAQTSIHFLAFSFTHDGIGGAVMERAKAGVQVAGVFETTGSQTKFSEYGRMKQAGIDVLTDGNPYSMHHKVFIIDGREVVFGSFNFSDSADKDNDENVLIIDDPALAQAFEAEFQRVRQVALNPPQKR